jgi:hypothetical protein
MRPIDKVLTAFTPRPVDASHSLLTVRSPNFAIGRGSWFELSVAFEFLERNPDALAFVGPALLDDPSFVTAVLRRANELDALPAYVVESLTRVPGDDEFQTRIEDVLPYAHRREIALALASLEASFAEGPQREAVTEALDGYWRSLLD